MPGKYNYLHGLAIYHEISILALMNIGEWNLHDESFTLVKTLLDNFKLKLAVFFLFLCFRDFFWHISCTFRLFFYLFYVSDVLVTDPIYLISVPLMHHDRSDLRSQILIRILPKEHTQTYLVGLSYAFKRDAKISFLRAK